MLNSYKLYYYWRFKTSKQYNEQTRKREDKQSSIAHQIAFSVNVQRINEIS